MNPTGDRRGRLKLIGMLGLAAALAALASGITAHSLAGVAAVVLFAGVVVILVLRNLAESPAGAARVLDLGRALAQGQGSTRYNLIVLATYPAGFAAIVLALMSHGARAFDPTSGNFDPAAVVATLAFLVGSLLVVTDGKEPVAIRFYSSFTVLLIFALLVQAVLPDPLDGTGWRLAVGAVDLVFSVLTHGWVYRRGPRIRELPR